MKALHSLFLAAALAPALLSVSAPADRLEDAWTTRLQATASEISSALGFDEHRQPNAR